MDHGIPHPCAHCGGPKRRVSDEASGLCSFKAPRFAQRKSPRGWMFQKCHGNIRGDMGKGWRPRPLPALNWHLNGKPAAICSLDCIRK